MGMRPKRVKEALRREVSLILQREIKDPRLGFTTVTRVEISNDLKNADIYYSVLGGDKDMKGTRGALTSAAGYIKKLIGDRLKMKFVPEIRFKVDESMERTRRVFEILEDIKEERKPDEHREDNSLDKEP